MIYDQQVFEKTLLMIKSNFPNSFWNIILMIQEIENEIKWDLDLDENILKFWAVLFLLADFWATEQAIFSRPIRHWLEKNDIPQDQIENIVSLITNSIFPLNEKYLVLNKNEIFFKKLYKKYFN